MIFFLYITLTVDVTFSGEVLLIMVGFPFSAGPIIPTVSGESSSTSQDPDPYQPLSFTPMPTDFPTHTGDNVGLLAAVMVGGPGLLLVLAVVGVPLIVIIVIILGKKGKQRTSHVALTDGSCSG